MQKCSIFRISFTFSRNFALICFAEKWEIFTKSELRNFREKKYGREIINFDIIKFWIFFEFFRFIHFRKSFCSLETKS